MVSERTLIITQEVAAQSEGRNERQERGITELFLPNLESQLVSAFIKLTFGSLTYTFEG